MKSLSRRHVTLGIVECKKYILLFINRTEKCQTSLCTDSGPLRAEYCIVAFHTIQPSSIYIYNFSIALNCHLEKNLTSSDKITGGLKRIVVYVYLLRLIERTSSLLWLILVRFIILAFSPMFCCFNVMHRVTVTDYSIPNYASCSGCHDVAQGNVNILHHLHSDRRYGASTKLFLNLLIPFHLNNLTNPNQLTSHSTTCRTAWRSYRGHRLLWR